MKATKLQALVGETKRLLDKGVWQPNVLFIQLNARHSRVHYSTIRKAIHIAKSEIYH